MSGTWYYRDGNDDFDGLYKHDADGGYYYMSSDGWVQNNGLIGKVSGMSGDTCDRITEDEARAYAKFRGWRFVP